MPPCHHFRAPHGWWRRVTSSADRVDDYRIAQFALVRAGMPARVSRSELDAYLAEIRAARSPTSALAQAGFLAGMGVVLAGLVLFAIGILIVGGIEHLLRPEIDSAVLDAESIQRPLPSRLTGAGIAATPGGGVPVFVGLLLALALGAFGIVLALLERARFERQRAPYTFAHRRRRPLTNAHAEALAWVAVLGPVTLALAAVLSESAALPVLFLLGLGLLLFRSLWYSAYPRVLRAVSRYNAAGLAAHILSSEAAVIEGHEEAFYGKGVWRRWVRHFGRRVDWGST